MKIGNEIKQTKFKNEYQKMLINILFTSGWLSSKHSGNLKPYGISSQQYNILRILRGQHPQPATVNLLIDRMLDKNSNASRLVDRLQEKGFVNRCTSDSDKRSVNVQITEKGLDRLKQIDDQTLIFEETLRTLSKDEARELNRLLDKLRG